jgi:hypothetical protein
MGDQKLSEPREGLIAGQIEITSIRAELTRPGILKSDLLGRFWKQWKQAHAVNWGRGNAGGRYAWN